MKICFSILWGNFTWIKTNFNAIKMFPFYGITEYKLNGKSTRVQYIVFHIFIIWLFFPFYGNTKVLSNLLNIVNPCFRKKLACFECCENIKLLYETNLWLRSCDLVAFRHRCQNAFCHRFRPVANGVVKF